MPEVEEDEEERGRGGERRGATGMEKKAKER